MNTKLLKSVASLAFVVAIAAGATYAAIPSNIGTIQGVSASSGIAEIKLCNEDGTFKDWVKTIAPGLSTSGLTPGDTTGKELTFERNIFIGNDGGDLPDTNPGHNCVYNREAAGTSDQNLRIKPSVTAVNCPTGSTVNPANVDLKIIVGTKDSGWKTLTSWESSPTFLTSYVMGVNHAQRVQIFARLDSSVTDAGETCTFNILFNGESTDDAQTTSPIT